jgi:hypothetical protein
MPLKLGDDDASFFANARIAALACNLAYLPEAEGAAGFRERLGMEAKLFSADNVQAYLATDAENVLVAFRGSEAPTSLDGLKDWLVTNANNFLILPEGEIGTDFAAAGVAARFHRGFMEALAKIWPALFPQAQAAMQEKERPLWIVGHSLGGALAVLAAWRFLQQFIMPHKVFTFGAPMIGNKQAAEAFARELPGRIHRFIDLPDVVPLLPTMSLMANEFIHVDGERPLDSTGKGGAASAIGAIQALAAATVGGMFDLSLKERLWLELQGRLKAHDIVNYAALVDAEITRLG